MAVIKIKHPGRCADCGAELQPGAVVRYYGRGRMYGTTCHPQHVTRSTPAERRARAQVLDSTIAWQRTMGHRQDDAWERFEDAGRGDWRLEGGAA